MLGIIYFFFFLGSIYTDFLANLQAACSKKFEEENQCVVKYVCVDKCIMAGINMCVWINVAVYR